MLTHDAAADLARHTHRPDTGDPYPLAEPVDTLDQLAAWFREHTDPDGTWRDPLAFAEHAAVALVDAGYDIDPPEEPQHFTAWLTVAVPLTFHPATGAWTIDGASLAVEQYAHEPNTVTDENGLRLSDDERENERDALTLARTAVEHLGDPAS